MLVRTSHANSSALNNVILQRTLISRLFAPALNSDWSRITVYIRYDWPLRMALL